MSKPPIAAVMKLNVLSLPGLLDEESQAATPFFEASVASGNEPWAVSVKTHRTPQRSEKAMVMKGLIYIPLRMAIAWGVVIERAHSS